jgi:hypothetical protein
MALSSDEIHDRLTKADVQQFGQLIELYRSSCGLSVEGLARRVGMPALDVGKLETGRARRKPSAERIRLLADVLAECRNSDLVGATAGAAPTARTRKRNWFGDASIVSVLVALLTIVSILTGLASNATEWFKGDDSPSPTAAAIATTFASATVSTATIAATKVPTATATVVPTAAPVTRTPRPPANPARTAQPTAASPVASPPGSTEGSLSVTIPGTDGQSIGRIVAAPIGAKAGWSRIRVSLTTTGGDPTRFHFALAEQDCARNLTEIWPFQRSESTQEVPYSLSQLRELAVRLWGPGPEEERCVRLDEGG